ncbi:transglutaminase family protein [Aromatoleum toluclasticum]|uniref:transglutaminase-like domain-containing protein n=1 Tax=Aromatoleum toluclasticum TaxID=92003 RepID=UPI001D193B37|nr:transglutaminase family protein [Aromatoleum toluclasticum]MCC4113951.1 transglutaminase family protein [Aromatoleum toluclasticum]
MSGMHAKPKLNATSEVMSALEATPLVDSNHPAVGAFACSTLAGISTKPRERAVALYYAVRDGFRYDPYDLDFSAPAMKASRVLEVGSGWCIPKAALLAACCRSSGIPARLGFADVRNHLSTERMQQLMGTDLFIWHGYTEIWLDNAWRKATPAFNIELCQRFGLAPLEFDGASDSIYHAYDRAGNRHMEYVTERGSFNDIPLERIASDFLATYPTWMAQKSALAGTDFSEEV